MKRILLHFLLVINLSYVLAQDTGGDLEDPCDLNKICRSRSLIYSRNNDEIMILLAAHIICSKRGWAGFGSICDENEGKLEAAIRETFEETGGAYSKALLSERFNSEKSIENDGVTTYVVEVKDKLDESSIENSVEDATEQEFKERGPYKWIKWSILKELIRAEDDTIKLPDSLQFPTTSANWLALEFSNRLRDEVNNFD